jgi:hypothetical protein
MKADICPINFTGKLHAVFVFHYFLRRSKYDCRYSPKNLTSNFRLLTPRVPLYRYNACVRPTMKATRLADLFR